MCGFASHEVDFALVSTEDGLRHSQNKTKQQAREEGTI